MMKHLLLLCISLLMVVSSQAQNLNDVPVEERDSAWYAKRDSLLALDRDTSIGNIIHLGIIGDVITGYNFKAEPAYPDSIVWDDTTFISSSDIDSFYVTHYNEDNKHPHAFRWYHTDNKGNSVRQIVVLRICWPNLPDDLKNHTETSYDGSEVLFSVEAGYRLAALTPKEYAEYKSRDLIWGECFESSWPEGTDTLTIEEKRKIPGIEIVCYSEDSLPLWKAPYIGPDQRKISREIMHYTDTLDGKSYMCAAPNYTTSHADYTKAGSGGKYETRWITADETESASWWQRTIDYISSLEPVQAFMRWWKEV